MHQRVVLFQQVIAHDGRQGRAEAVGDVGNGRFDILRAHVGGGGVHEITQQRAGISLTRKGVSISARRHDKKRWLGLVLQVAFKAVGAIGPACCDMGKRHPAIAGNRIGAFGKFRCDGGDGQRVLPLANACQHMAQLAVFARLVNDLPRRAGKPLPLGQRTCAGERIILQAVEAGWGEQVDGSRFGPLGGETLMHLRASPGDLLIRWPVLLTEP